MRTQPGRAGTGLAGRKPPPLPRPARGEPRVSSGEKGRGLLARATALEILLRVEDGAFADVLLGHRLPAFSPPDRRLITALVLGTTAWRARLDYELEMLVRDGLGRLSRPVLALLRMGLYQLRFLSRVGAHAAVSTAVALAKQRPQTRDAAGLVNAVLRRAAGRPEPPLPDAREQRLRHLSVKYSHPEWLVARMIEWFGEDEARALLEAHNQPAPNWIRLNLARATRGELLARLNAAGFELEPWGSLPETMVLASAPPVESAAKAQGLFTPQSAASQMVARLLAPEKGARVLDCAAAPGGKTTHLAELTGLADRIFAMDRRLAGLRAAQRLAHTLGHRNIAFVCAGLGSGIPFRARSFDFVLLDAPCSGLGTLRSHPEIRWRLKPRDLKRLAAMQGEMLKSASAMVKPNGVIVYAVCSFAPSEGIEVVRRFLERHPEFAPDAPGPPFDHMRLAKAPEGFLCLCLRPSRGGFDGFFAARLRRSGER